jgi:hypothetical protein
MQCSKKRNHLKDDGSPVPGTGRVLSAAENGGHSGQDLRDRRAS